MASTFKTNVFANVANVLGTRTTKIRRKSFHLDHDLEAFEEDSLDRFPKAADAETLNLHDDLESQNASNDGQAHSTTTKFIDELKTRQKHFTAELRDKMRRLQIQGSHTTLHTEEELEELKNDIRKADEEIAYCNRQLLAWEGVKEMQKKDNIMHKELEYGNMKIKELETRINNQSPSPNFTVTALERENSRLRQENDERREEKEELFAMVANSRGRELEYQRRIEGLMKELKDADDIISKYVAALKK